jgi:hypothetical protein
MREALTEKQLSHVQILIWFSMHELQKYAGINSKGGGRRGSGEGKGKGKGRGEEGEGEEKGRGEGV